MIKLIQQFISTIKCGRHSGKGMKYYRKKNYEKALYHYELASQYQNKCFAWPNPALLENLAITHAQLGNLNKALTIAEQSINLYRELSSQKQYIAEAIVQLEYFIELLRKGNNENIKNYLAR